MGVKLFAQLQKVDAARREVWGIIAAEEPDRAGEVFDYASSKPLFAAWSASVEKASGGKSLGNVRSMHNKVASGKLIALDFDDLAKTITVGARVVDEAEWAKVEEGVYTGFSIGGDYANRWRDPSLNKMRYTASPVEVSLVDMPCMPSALFEMVKVDGSSEMRKFAETSQGEEQAEVAADSEQDTVKSETPADEAAATDATATDAALTETLAEDASEDGESNPFAQMLAKMNADNAELLRRLADLEQRATAEAGTVAPESVATTEVEKASDSATLAKADGATAPEMAHLTEVLVEGLLDAAAESADLPGGEDADEDDPEMPMVEVSLVTIGVLHQQIISLGARCPGIYPESEYYQEECDRPALNPTQYVLDQIHDTLVALGHECTDVSDMVKAASGELAKAAGMDEDVELAKAGRRISAGNMLHVQHIHDAACMMGASCGVEKAADGAELAEQSSEREQLQKMVGELQTQSKKMAKDLAKASEAAGVIKTQEATIGALRERIDKLEAMPMPGGPILSTEALAKLDPAQLQVLAVEKVLGGGMEKKANPLQAQIDALHDKQLRTPDMVERRRINSEIQQLRKQMNEGH